MWKNSARFVFAALNSFFFSSNHVCLLTVQAFDEASSTKGKPTAVIAKTFKGYKFPDISDKDNWHGKPLGDKGEAVIQAIQQQMEATSAKVNIVAPVEDAPAVDISNVRMSSGPAYKIGDSVATRVAYGTVLKKLAEGNSRVVALDGDTKNSTYSEKIKNVRKNAGYNFY